MILFMVVLSEANRTFRPKVDKITPWTWIEHPSSSITEAKAINVALKTMDTIQMHFTETPENTISSQREV